MRVLLVSANREQLPSPVVPLGLLSVAGGLAGAHEVRLTDLCFEPDPLAAVARAVEDFRPDVVGVGIRNLHTNAYDGTERLIEEYRQVVDAAREASCAAGTSAEAGGGARAGGVRAAGDGARIVLGGSGFSLRPGTLLEELGGDHGVVGEGELAFRAICDALAAGDVPPRLVVGGAATAGAIRPAPSILGARGRAGGELDLLPRPDRSLIDPRYYAHDGTDNVQTKRGCAFTCAYCDYPDLEGRKVRVRSPEAIADEVLERSQVPGVSHVFFVDSVFNVPRSHAIAVCDALVERGKPLPWVCYGSPAALDEEVVAAMARAGCQGVEIGTDTGTPRMLERLRKPFSLCDVLETRRRFIDHGLLDAHTFVLGALDETPDEVRETLAFVDRLDPDIAVFIVFMEDREDRSIHRARHRDAILELLAREAPRRPGWVVPELSIRFGQRVARLAARARFRGPSWLQLARARRASGHPPGG
jgi:sugar phosphate isomerase/epimerase